MEKLSAEEFLSFLGEALMYEEGPLEMDKPFPPLIFDSTGVLMLAAALEERFGLILPLEELGKMNAPGDVYEYLRRSL